MEVGIHKGRGEGPEGTLLIYDHLGEYTLSKKPGGWYTPQYTTGCYQFHCLMNSLPKTVTQQHRQSPIKFLVVNYHTEILHIHTSFANTTL